MSAIRTHVEFYGLRFPRHPQDIARDQWIADRIPAALAALEVQDSALSDAFEDVDWRKHPDALDAYRKGDAAAFLQIVRRLVTTELANDAEMAVEDEAYARYPEAEA